MKYKVLLTDSAKQDISRMKRYILLKFKYRELAENFSRKIKKALKGLDVFPQGFKHTSFNYKGYEIILKPSNLPNTR